MSTRKPTYTLNEKQRTELKVQMEKFQHDGHYGAAYKYLMDNIPRSEYRGNAPVHSSDEAGLSAWLSVAISTNTRSGDIVDTTLRSLTKEIMKERGVSDGNFNDKYNKFSNELAVKILTDITDSGEVSREKIIQARFNLKGRLKLVFRRPFKSAPAIFLTFFINLTNRISAQDSAC